MNYAAEDPANAPSGAKRFSNSHFYSEYGCETFAYNGVNVSLTRNSTNPFFGSTTHIYPWWASNYLWFSPVVTNFSYFDHDDVLLTLSRDDGMTITSNPFRWVYIPPCQDITGVIVNTTDL